MRRFFTLFILISYADLRGLGSKNFRNSSYKEKLAGSTTVSKLSFRFLWLYFKVVLKIRVVSVVNYEIVSNVVLHITIISAVNDEVTFNVAFQICAVSGVNDETIFNVVLKMSVVPVVNDQIIFNAGRKWVESA